MTVPSSQNVDWHLLAEAVDYYKSKGYTYTEVPWIVESSLIYQTLPEGATPFVGLPVKRVPYDSYPISYGPIGSAEQGFLSLLYKEYFNKDFQSRLHCSLTPCFRDEETLDDLHQKHFMKVELFFGETDRHPYRHNERQEIMNKMISNAQEFMSRYMKVSPVEITPMDEYGRQQVDLLTEAGVEVGSYGIRRAGDNMFWVYGTGLAEPRFSFLHRTYGQ